MASTTALLAAWARACSFLEVIAVIIALVGSSPQHVHRVIEVSSWHLGCCGIEKSSYMCTCSWLHGPQALWLLELRWSAACVTSESLIIGMVKLSMTCHMCLTLGAVILGTALERSFRSQ